MGGTAVDQKGEIVNDKSIPSSIKDNFLNTSKNQQEKLDLWSMSFLNSTELNELAAKRRRLIDAFVENGMLDNLKDSI